jgi:hypothetical protein
MMSQRYANQVYEQSFIQDVVMQEDAAVPSIAILNEKLLPLPMPKQAAR